MLGLTTGITRYVFLKRGLIIYHRPGALSMVAIATHRRRGKLEVWSLGIIAVFEVHEGLGY